MPIKAMRLSVLMLCGLIAGCSVVEFVIPEGPPSYEQIYASYEQTMLNKSTSADVLTLFGRPSYAIISQSKSIIALTGEKKKGFKIWFDMVSFEENELIAKRKYVFISDEKPKQLFVEPWEGVDFSCQIVLPRQVLDEPYANENARRIAILKEIGIETRKDTTEVGADNKDIETSGFVIGQGIDILTAKLNESPALAARLSEPNGLEFKHVSYDQGKLRMVVENDIATVRMLLGSFAKDKKISIEHIRPMQ